MTSTNFGLKGEIAKKNQYNKKTKKKFKRIKFKLKKITYHKLGLKNEIENKSKFYKRT
jgi:hypothetical protein